LEIMSEDSMARFPPGDHGVETPDGPGSRRGRSVLQHATAFVALSFVVSVVVLAGREAGGPVLVGAATASLVAAMGLGHVMFGEPLPLNDTLLEGARRFSYSRRDFLWAMAGTATLGALIVVLLPGPGRAGLLGAALIVPCGYLVAEARGSSDVLLTTHEAVLLLRGRLVWRAPLGPNSWVRLDNAGTRGAPSYVEVGVGPRSMGRVVDHSDLHRPEFVRLVGELRELARQRPELFLVDNLRGLKTGDGPAQVSLVRTSVSKREDHSQEAYELPPPDA
jgi:hypothetical protein